MFELEDRYWWFVGRRRVALRLLKRYTSDRMPNAERRMPKILDLGCGTGVISRELQDWAEPISLDMSSLALEFSRKRGLTNLIQARGEWLPIKSNSVDAVLAL